MTKLLKNKTKGFTLIELMIVVAIIGILAAIAIPNFIRYQLRSKTAEGRNNVRAIKTGQEGFRASEDNYIGTAGIIRPVGAPNPVKQAWVDTACPAACNRVGIVNCTEFDCVGFKADGAVYYQYETSTRTGAAGTPPEFCVGARSDLDGDGQFGGYELQSVNSVGQTIGVVDCGQTAGACGAGMSNGEMLDCSVGVF